MKKLNRVLVCVLAGWMAWMFANTEVLGESFSGDDPLATTSVGSNEMILYPHAGLNVERFILTVSGPENFISRQSFEAGNAPYFRLTGTGVDGQYNYELLGIPALLPEVRELLAEARKTGDDSLISELRNAGSLPMEKLVQSGHFWVREGRILTAGQTATGTNGDQDNTGNIVPADQQILDDLIVDGSACIGLDCVNGESFGFDTIILKENNLRIFFNDTSATASFPSVDWRLVANDSTNGGANYFAIEDVTNARRIFSVTANAPSNSLYVDDRGRVGLETATPVVKLHMADGNTPTVRLDQDGSEGWGIQVWDVAGNEANFFIRDATNGSTLPFRIKPGAKNNTLTVQVDGKVGIGTWAPQKELHVMGDALIEGSLELSSSRELKENIDVLSSDEALAALRDLRPVKYNYKTNKRETVVGFVAEEVPELVATNSRKTLNPMDIVATLTRVVQEQQKTIAELNRRLDALEHRDLEISY